MSFRVVREMPKINCEATHKKREGNFSLNDRELIFISKDQQLNRAIALSTVISTQLAISSDQTSSLINIKTIDNPEGHIFKFKKEYTHFRDLLDDILNKRIKVEPNKVENFWTIPQSRRDLIHLLLTDKYMQFFYEETSELLSREELVNYLFLKHRNKLDDKTQKTVLSRSDELVLNQNHNRSKTTVEFNYNLLNKIKNSDEDFNILFNIAEKKGQTKRFLEEFLENQRKNETEIVGELKPIFFTNEQMHRINEEKNSESRRKKHTHKKAQPKYTLNQIKFYHVNYFSTPLNIKEYDRAANKIEEHTGNRVKEKSQNTMKLISNLNDYSLRKLKLVEPRQSSIQHKDTNNITSESNDIEMADYGYEKILKHRVPNEEKVNDMLKEFDSLKVNPNSAEIQYLNRAAFLDLNDRIKDNIKNLSTTFLCNEVDNQAVEFLKLEQSFLKDIKEITSLMKKPEIFESKRRALTKLCEAAKKRIADFKAEYKGKQVSDSKMASQLKEQKEKISFCLDQLIMSYTNLIK